MKVSQSVSRPVRACRNAGLDGQAAIRRAVAGVLLRIAITIAANFAFVGYAVGVCVDQNA